MSSPPRKLARRPTILPPPLAPARDRPVGSRISSILELLARGKRFLVCSHTRPDGDSVGSMLALGMIVEQMGKRAILATAEPIPPHYRQLPGAQAIRAATSIQGRYDAAIVLECDSIERTRLRGLEKLFLVNIDHHVTGREFAHLNWIDCGAASVGEMVYRLARAAGAVLTPQMAQCIYTTLLTDTGGFCYGNVRASTFALARDLTAAGADPVAIARQVYFSAPASKFLLLGIALRRLKHEGRLAWLWVTHRDMRRVSATEEDCEGIVSVVLGMADVDAVAFLREAPGRIVRVSLRGKSGLNVAAVAARLGGGGHVTAAGCTLSGSLPSALKKILAELRCAIAEQKAKPSHRASAQRKLRNSGEIC